MCNKTKGLTKKDLLPKVNIVSNGKRRVEVSITWQKSNITQFNACLGFTEALRGLNSLSVALPAIIPANFCLLTTEEGFLKASHHSFVLRCKKLYS